VRSFGAGSFLRFKYRQSEMVANLKKKLFAFSALNDLFNNRFTCCTGALNHPVYCLLRFQKMVWSRQSGLRSYNLLNK
jgi:hypothetical protein